MYLELRSASAISNANFVSGGIFDLILYDVILTKLRIVPIVLTRTLTPTYSSLVL